MRAARLAGPKHFEFVDTEIPTASDGQCLIKLERVSVCGSDIRHGYQVHPEEEYPMTVGLPCHELAGVVVESRTDDFREGQRAIVIPTRGSGGLVEYIVSSPDRMILLPDEGPLDEWIMCQPSGTVLYACQQMPNLLGKNVLVLGQGSIGLSFTMITSRSGARNVIVADLLDYRLAKAKEFGATHTINPDKDDIEQAVAEITGGLGPDIVVEAAGYPETFAMCFRLIRQFGTIIIFGVQTQDFVSIEHPFAVGQATADHSYDRGAQRRPNSPYQGDRRVAPAGMVRAGGVNHPQDRVLSGANGLRYVRATAG